MNRRLTRTLSALTLLAILFSVLLGAAQPVLAAGNNPDLFVLNKDNGGNGMIIRDNNVNGFWADVSAPNDVTIPNLDTDSCTAGGPTCQEESVSFGPVFHFRGSCLYVSTIYKKVENNAQQSNLEVEDGCATGTGGDPVVLYKQDMTAGGWRSTYVMTNTTTPMPHFYDGWTGQTNFNNDLIELQITRPSFYCVTAKIMNQGTSAWDTFYNSCDVRTPGYDATDETYAFIATQWGALNKFNSGGDLGADGVIMIYGMSLQNQSGSGLWDYPVREQVEERGQWNRWDNPVAPITGSRIFPQISDNWYYEYGADLGFTGDTGNLWLCDKRNGNAGCDYTMTHIDYDSYHAYNPAVAPKVYFETKPQDALVIQRAPTDNSIVRGYDPKLKADRSYYIRQMNGGIGSTLWVDVAGLGAGNYSIMGQGYVKKDLTGTNPTCSWVTGTKYQCVPAVGSALAQVYIKVKTTAAITVNGLTVQGNNDEFATRTRTVHIAP
jgi:hypothetical protein